MIFFFLWGNEKRMVDVMTSIWWICWPPRRSMGHADHGYGDGDGDGDGYGLPITFTLALRIGLTHVRLSP